MANRPSEKTEKFRKLDLRFDRLRNTGLSGDCAREGFLDGFTPVCTVLHHLRMEVNRSVPKCPQMSAPVKKIVRLRHLSENTSGVVQ